MAPGPIWPGSTGGGPEAQGAGAALRPPSTLHTSSDAQGDVNRWVLPLRKVTDALDKSLHGFWETSRERSWGPKARAAGVPWESRRPSGPMPGWRPVLPAAPRGPFPSTPLLLPAWLTLATNSQQRLQTSSNACRSVFPAGSAAKELRCPPWLLFQLRH